MADTKLDKSLVEGLKLARKRDAAKPCFFTLIVKSASEGVLLVDKKKIPVKKVAELKKESGGTVIVKGLCFAEAENLVFETAKPPAPNWTPLTKRLAKESAGLAIVPVFRQGRDDEAVPESAGDNIETTGREPTPQPETAPDTAGAAWKARVDAITALVKAAAAAGNPAARDMALGISQAGAYFRGGKPADAAAKLAEVEALLAAAPVTAPPTDPAAEWKAKLAEYQAAIKAALAAKGPTVADITKLFAQATALSKPGGDMPQALAKLAECNALALAATAGTPAPTGGDAAAAKAQWTAARTTAVADLRELAAELAQSKLPETAKGLILINSIIKNLTPEPWQPRQVDELVRYLTDDDVVADAGLAFDLSGPLLESLAELKRRLPAE